ncbi:MAG: hypothetical protein Q9M36_07015 [Sulfurovum sp.]|nr:hypothetical protein [Sulfurovum sp.]
MGGFSDNYECGYWDEETTPSKVPKKSKTLKHNKRLYLSSHRTE